jgi:hypothetical protein
MDKRIEKITTNNTLSDKQKLSKLIYLALKAFPSSPYQKEIIIEQNRLYAKGDKLND